MGLFIVVNRGIIIYDAKSSKTSATDNFSVLKIKICLGKQELADIVDQICWRISQYFSQITSIAVSINNRHIPFNWERSFFFPSSVNWRHSLNRRFWKTGVRSLSMERRPWKTIWNVNGYFFYDQPSNEYVVISGYLWYVLHHLGHNQWYWERSKTQCQLQGIILSFIATLISFPQRKIREPDSISRRYSKQTRYNGGSK